MRRSIVFVFIFLCSGIYANTHALKSAIADIQTSMTMNKSLGKNPLENAELETLASRSYLYLYRALGYAHMAKHTSAEHKLAHLTRAQDDLKRAKTSPYPDTDRIEKTNIEILKSFIDASRAAKHHRAVIESIEQLPHSVRAVPYYIVIYADALFSINRISDLKRFARNNLSTLQDDVTVKRHLPHEPAWKSIVAGINIPASTPKLSVVNGAVKAPSSSIKSELLAEPGKTLARLRSDHYFKSSESTFKVALSLYLDNYKKGDALGKHERQFVKVFQRQMHNFAPNYVDSLIGTFWKLADLRSAEMLSLSFLAHFEGHPLYTKTLYNLGRLQEDSQNYKPAAKTYKKFIEISDDATYLEAARFRAGWVLYLDKREDEAKTYFEAYVKDYPEGRYASTCEYFLIKIQSTRKDFNAEDAVLAFVKKYPLNLYSFILVDEHKNFSTTVRDALAMENNLKAHAEIQDFKANMRTIGLLRVADELKLFGLKDEAIAVLKKITVDANNEWLHLFLATQFQELDDTHGVVSNLIKIAGSTHPSRALVPWKHLFPHYQHDLIERTIKAQELALSPFLVLSVIRQESAFDKSARSTANAIGLMQLTQSTAQDAAKAMKMDAFSLLNEEDNLALGVKTLGTLLKKYQRIDYALCAYNAGEGPTRLWINLRGHLDPIKFIESIPFPETRTYVKGILRNLAIYQMLYAPNSTPLVSYDFPR